MSNSIYQVIGNTNIESFLIAKKHIDKPRLFTFHTSACTELAEVLPAPELSIPDGFEAIIKVFENASYIGELRQRWLEIKKLLKGGLPDVNTISV